jgi:cytochrome c553
MPTICLLAFALAPGVAFAAQGKRAEACAACHEAVVEQFSQDVHSRIAGFETPDGTVGCAAYHGEVARHGETRELAGVMRFHQDR